ncbi:MAG: hypothetical protein ACLGPL_07320 [Acidobacteriota bacterium]
METPKSVVGGRCEYRSYDGVAEIVSVTLIGRAEERGRDTFEVKFRFHTHEAIAESFARGAAGDEPIQLLSVGGEIPRRDFTEAQGLIVGKRIPCVLQAIVKGTCTPVIFKFPWDGQN